MKKLTLFLMILTSSFIFSQNITIRGKVLDKNTKTPLEFVTIAVYDKLTQKALGGTTSLKDGTFRLTTNAKSFYIEVSFIGFKTKKITDFKNKNNQVNLKTVILEEKAQTLDEVVIQTEKSTTEFRLDKRVFNVGKDLSSVGANALEVLNNVPSVTVNIEGQISLRGSTGVQMLINGKPSVLASEESNALGTITADMIERIEVITNPSAKYDAEGTTGIINIVLKKNKKRGLNGSITLNTGIPNNHSLGLSLNKRTERFNLFSQLGAGYRTYPNKSEGINRNIIRGSEVNSKGEGSKNESFYNIILGTDYHINSLNVLTLSGNFAYEKEREDADTKYNELQNNALINKWNRSEKTKGTNPKWEYELQYKKQFKSHKDHGLLISATGNFFGKNNKSDFESKALLGTKTNNPERSETKFNEARYTYKLDYTKPFLEKYTFELGSQYNITDVTNNYKVSNLTGKIWINNANLTNTFNYNQGVFATYGTLGYEGEKWGLKAGLRVENTNLKTELKNNNQRNNTSYTNWFPSIHTSYKLSNGLSLQAGYSRRVSRPRLWHLNPFFGLRNNYSIYTGNPNLKPEFSDSYEISSIHKIKKVSLNMSLYYRFTTNVRERVVTFKNNVNITKPENIGTNAATGFELNGNYNISKWISIRGNYNYNYFNREGNYKEQNFNFKGSRWTSRITTKIKLPADFDAEISGNYRSKYKEFQSDIPQNSVIDFGLRKKILNGKGVINLSIRDMFATRTRESTRNIPDQFYTYNKRQRGRFFTIGFSYGFGKGQAMTFSGIKGY